MTKDAPIGEQLRKRPSCAGEPSPLAARGGAMALGLPLLMMAAAAAAVACGRMSSGIGADSVTYLDAARSLASGAGLAHRWAFWDPVYETCALPTRVSLWPPGYPYAIAGLISLGAPGESAGRAISLASWALLPAPLYGLLRLSLPPPSSLAATAAVLCASPWTLFSVQIGAESAFVLAFTLSMFAAARAVAAHGLRARCGWLAVSSVCAAGALALRYVGLGGAAAVGVVGVALAARASARHRAALLLCGVVPAGLGTACVMLRNRWVGGAGAIDWPGADVFWSTLPRAAFETGKLLLGSPQLLGWPSCALVWVLQLGAIGALLVLLLLPGAASIGRRHSERSAESGLQRRKMLRLAPHDVQPDPLSSVNRVQGAGDWGQDRTAPDRRGRPSRTEGRERPPSRGAPALTILLFVGALLAVTLAARAAKGINLEPRLVTISAPWLLLALLGTVLRAGSGARRRAAAAAVLVLSACQITVTGTMLRGDDGYIVAAANGPSIAWLREACTPNETLLATRGAEVAFSLPNPVLRLPRLPYSNHAATTWEEIDRLADRAGARYLVHARGYRTPARFDVVQADLLARLDDPAAAPRRPSWAFDDAIVYAVGSRR